MSSASYFSWKNYLAIKFWPSWFAYFLLRVLIKLPYTIQINIGKFVGTLFYFFAPYRRLIVSTNINLCFPNWPKERKKNIVKQHFQAVGMAIFDTAINWWGDADKLEPYTDFHGIENISEQLQQEQNVILLSFHFVSLEAPGRLFMKYQPFATTYQQLRNPLFNDLMTQAREKNIKKAIERRDVREMIRTIKAKIPMWIATDQDIGKKNSVFVPFFGNMAATQTSAMKLAKITNAKVLPVFIRRINKRIQVEILPALDNFPSNDIEFDARRLNTLLEKYILDCPEQYLWLHRKFKTRPNGEAKLYPQKPRRLKKKK